MKEKRYDIEFSYADDLSNFEWRTQHCSLYARNQYEAINKCKELYGLGIDCDYRITIVKEEG